LPPTVRVDCRQQNCLEDDMDRAGRGPSQKNLSVRPLRDHSAQHDGETDDKKGRRVRYADALDDLPGEDPGSEQHRRPSCQERRDLAPPPGSFERNARRALRRPSNILPIEGCAAFGQRGWLSPVRLYSHSGQRNPVSVTPGRSKATAPLVSESISPDSLAVLSPCLHGSYRKVARGAAAGRASRGLAGAAPGQYAVRFGFRSEASL